MTPEPLKITTCMAESADFICRAVAGYLAEKLDSPIEFINGIPWQRRERLFDDGQIQVCWICGLPYCWKADRGFPEVELIAAPVMLGARYQGLPVYFSDVVVHRDSRFQSFDDLRGASWAYNEPRSHSGFNVVRFHLARLGKASGYFGKVVESGAHHRSLRMVVAGEIDAAAIDSTVLEFLIRRSPELEAQIRVIHTLGPSPMPPWVCHSSVQLDVRRRLRTALLEMHKDESGKAILAQGQISRFMPVEDKDYDPIRDMARIAQGTTL